MSHCYYYALYDVNRWKNPRSFHTHTQQAHTCKSSGAIPLITTMPLNAIRLNAYRNTGIRDGVIGIFTVKEKKKTDHMHPSAA